MNPNILIIDPQTLHFCLYLYGFKGSLKWTMRVRESYNRDVYELRGIRLLSTEFEFDQDFSL